MVYWECAADIQSVHGRMLSLGLHPGLQPIRQTNDVPGFGILHSLFGRW
jgi:hypothetical protein